MKDTLTAGHLRDLLQRAVSVIEETEGADDHQPLVTELHDAEALLAGEIGASHMGVGAEVVLVERSIDPFETEHAVIEQLAARGITARLEYPGSVAIPTKDGDEWYAGTVNDTWSADLLRADGEHVRSVSTDVPSTSTDVDAIVTALVTAIREAPPVTSTESQVYIDGGAEALAEYRTDLGAFANDLLHRVAKGQRGGDRG